MSQQPLAYFDPDSCCWRTSQLCLFEAESESLQTLPPAGTWDRGALYARPTSERPTGGTGSSSLPPTPTANPYGSNRSQSEHASLRPSLEAIARQI